MEWYWIVVIVVYCTVFGMGFMLHLAFDGWSWGGGGTKSGWFAGFVFMALWPLWVALVPIAIAVDKLIVSAWRR